MTWFDDDGSPVESYDDAVAASTAMQDDPAEEEAAADPMAEAHVAAMTAARERVALDPTEPMVPPTPSDVLVRALAEQVERMAEVLARLIAHTQRMQNRLEAVEAHLDVGDEFGDRPLPLDTPDVGDFVAVADASRNTRQGERSGLFTDPDEPLSVDEINRRARAEAAATLAQDLAEGSGLEGVAEMVPAPLDDDVTDKPGFR